MAQLQIINDVAGNTYQRVEYIESTGTQWIDTGVTFNAGTDGFKARAQSSSTSHSGMLLATASNYTWMYFYGGSGIRMYFQDYSGTQRGIAGITHDLAVHDLEYTNKTYYVDGVNKGNVSSYTFKTSPATMKIGQYNNYYFFKGKIYEIKLYSSSEIVRDFVPCYRKSDGAVGMYDQVSGTFFANSGSGTFGKGSNVTNTFYSYIYESDSAIKFHRVLEGATPVGGWKTGHVYFIHNSGGTTGQLKLAIDDSGTLEDYTQAGNTNHTHASNQITSMAGYAMASAAGSITSTDSLNVAIGKLEKKLEGIPDLL